MHTTLKYFPPMQVQFEFQIDFRVSHASPNNLPLSMIYAVYQGILTCYYAKKTSHSYSHPNLIHISLHSLSSNSISFPIFGFSFSKSPHHFCSLSKIHRFCSSSANKLIHNANLY